MFDQTVTLASEATEDKFGTMTYGATTSYAARVNYKNTKILNANGEEQIASGVVWFEDNIVISLDSQITLPDGRQPEIIGVEQKIDDSDLTYTKIYFI